MKFAIAYTVWLAAELVSVSAQGYTGSLSRRDELDTTDDFALELLSRQYFDEAQATDVSSLVRRSNGELFRRVGNTVQQQRNNLQQHNNQNQQQNNQAQDQHNQAQHADNERIRAAQPGKAEVVCDHLAGICTTLGAAVSATGGFILAADPSSQFALNMAAIGGGAALLGTTIPHIKGTTRLCWKGVCKIAEFCNGCIRKPGQPGVPAPPPPPPGQGIPHNPGSMVRRDVLSQMLSGKGYPGLEIRAALLDEDIWY